MLNHHHQANKIKRKNSQPVPRLRRSAHHAYSQNKETFKKEPNYMKQIIIATATCCTNTNYNQQITDCTSETQGKMAERADVKRAATQ